MPRVFIQKSLLFFILCCFAFNVNAQSVGGVTTGGKIFCDTINSGFLSLSSENGTILNWESSTDSIIWTSIPNTINVQSYQNLLQTTWYRAIVQDGVFPPDTSTISSIIVYPASLGGTTSGGGVFCGTSGVGVIHLTGYTGSVQTWLYSTDNGVNWTLEPNTTDSLNYANLSQNTLYEAIVQTNVACVSDTSSITSFVFSPSIGGTLSSGGTYCVSSGSGTLTLTGEVGTILNWQYSTNSGASWTPVNNTTEQLSYTNITQNTIYEAVVQLNSCPADSSSQAFFVFNPTVVGNLSSGDTVCFGSNGGTINLSGSVGDIVGWLSSANDGASWTPIADTTTTLTYSNLTQTTLYQTIVKNGTCTADTASFVMVKVLPLPLVYAGTDMEIYKGETAKLNGVGVGTALWTPSTGLDTATILTPVSAVDHSIMYTLTITDSNSCVNSDSVFLTVNPKAFSGVIANLFTPNGDGMNDTWYLQGISDFSDNEVFVYNIYGNLVFTKKGYTNDWGGTYNGAPLPDGTYYYVVKFESSDTVYKGALDILKNK